MAQNQNMRRNSVGGARNHLFNDNNTISLGETLEANRKTVPLGREDHSISISSGYTAEPTDYTERSMSSSICLGENGQAMVATRIHSPKYHRKTPHLMPPPPFSEEEPEEREAQTKPKSQRRRSMFGSTTSTTPTKPCHESSGLSPKITKPRRRSFFGSSTHNGDQDLQLKPQSELFSRNGRVVTSRDSYEETVDLSPEKPQSSQFDASVQSLDNDGTEEYTSVVKNKAGSTRKKRTKAGKKFVKALFSPRKKKDSDVDGKKGNGGKDIVTASNRGIDELELAAAKPPDKPKSRRRHSLFGGAGGTDDPTISNPSPTPRHPRSRRRSLFGNTGEDPIEDENKGSSAAKQPSNTRRLLGKGPETTIATLAPRTNNPYELVNIERLRRQMPPFIRSMLLDSIAKDVALQLARSNGATCRSTDYHGNVGKGVDVWTIHEKMMSQKGIERSNIISADFFQYGIGMARDRDGQIYLCQLFQ